MDKSPAFQFYPNDWLSSEAVQLMTIAEQGAYIRLLCWDWMKDGLIDDDKRLAILSGLGEGWLKGSSVLLRECFVDYPGKVGFLTNPRLQKERIKQRMWREKCIKGGKKSAASRRKSKTKNKTSPLVGSKDELDSNSSSSSSSSISSSSKSTEAKASVSSEPKVLTQSKRIKWSNESGWKDIIEEDIQKWSEAYPACDINRELAAMTVWLIANPVKAKKSNYARFINTWLTRSQDRGGGTKSNQSPQSAKTGYIPANQNSKNDYGSKVI